MECILGCNGRSVLAGSGSRGNDLIEGIMSR